MLAGTLVTVVALVVLLIAEARGHRGGIWIAKPLASAGFVAAAAASPALHTPYGQRILTAAVLGAVGDVLLIPKRRATFLAGLVVFLGGHLVYVDAFLRHDFDRLWLGVGFLVLMVPAGLLQRWLRPHLSSVMRLPVNAYLLVISMMVAAAAASAPFALHPAAQLVGAVLFYLSDICVARHEFVSKSFANKLLGLPLYYAAQLLLVSTLH
jgi:uncharacterized membrane protein YhhN